MIFNLLPDYINERDEILNMAYINAKKNKHKHIIKWLFKINPSKLYIIRKENNEKDNKYQ